MTAVISGFPAPGWKLPRSGCSGHLDIGAGGMASISGTRDIGGRADNKDKKKDKKHELVAPTAEVGDSSFDLLPKGANLWVKNAAQESALVAEMRKGKALIVKATSKKGNLTTDTYSLSGFAQAIDRALKDCPGG